MMEAMQAVRSCLSGCSRRTQPNPAFIVDGLWNLIDSNRGRVGVSPDGSTQRSSSRRSLCFVPAFTRRPATDLVDDRGVQRAASIATNALPEARYGTSSTASRVFWSARGSLAPLDRSARCRVMARGHRRRGASAPRLVGDVEGAFFLRHYQRPGFVIPIAGFFIGFRSARPGGAPAAGPGNRPPGTRPGRRRAPWAFPLT